MWSSFQARSALTQHASSWTTMSRTMSALHSFAVLFIPAHPYLITKITPNSAFLPESLPAPSSGYLTVLLLPTPTQLYIVFRYLPVSLGSLPHVPIEPVTEASLRIIHITRQFFPGYGGLETVVENLASRQAAKGHDVTVVTLNKLFGSNTLLPASERLDAVKIIRISFFGSQRYPIALLILKHVRDADVVHVHAIDFFFDFMALTQILHRKTMIVSTHGGFFHTKFASRLKKVYFASVTRLNIARYAFVAASSDHDLRTFSGIRPRGIGSIVNGVDCSKFADLTRATAPKQAIYFGRLAPNKNIAALFPLIAAVRRIDPAWRLVIAGRPMGVTVHELAEHARSAGVETAVTIMDSPSDEMLRKAISCSSVFVSPSDYEGFGISAIEGLSGGLLPVLSDIDAHRDTVRATGYGLLADFSRPEILAQKMLSAWRDWNTGGYDEAEVAARLETFSWAAVVDQFEEIYAKVVGDKERNILGSRIKVLRRDEAKNLIDDAVAEAAPLRVAFLNVHLANKASSNPAVAEALQGFNLLNDGLGVDLASNALYGRQFPDNLNGTDLIPDYLDRSNHRLRLFLLGATQPVISAAAEVYARRWPQHSVVGIHHGFCPPEQERVLANRIRAVRPDIVLVGMGNPRQELWLARNIPDVCPVGIAVGALFDFQTGKIARAPEAVRKARLEWLYRLSQEPRRLVGRYLVGNAVFVGRVVLQVARGERA